ncbi:unnamed protein product, partial [Iphiclides podalirius]
MHLNKAHSDILPMKTGEVTMATRHYRHSPCVIVDLVRCRPTTGSGTRSFSADFVRDLGSYRKERDED